jgi:hypothetical protein
MGFLLKLFQITATKPVRDKAIELFTELSLRKNCLDLTLTKAELPRRDADLAPKFENMGTAQAFTQTSVRNCSSEFRKVIEVARESIILKLILQLMNVPVIDANLEQACDTFTAYMKKEGHSTWYDLLVAEGVLHQITDMSVVGGDEEESSEFSELDAELVEIRKKLEEAGKLEEDAKRELEGLATAPTPTAAAPSMMSRLKGALPKSLPSIGAPSSGTTAIMATGPITVTTSTPISLAKPETPEVKPEPKPETPEVKPEPKPETPEVKPEPKPETPEVKPEPKPETPEVKPEPKPETPEVKPESKPETPEVKPESKPETPEVKPETTPESKPEPTPTVGGRIKRNKQSTPSSSRKKRLHSQSRLQPVHG